MKAYHGERTERGCEVTVDGKPLRHRSDLSGNATSPFDWGFVGTGQLSVALLSDFLGNDPQAKEMCEAFEKAVVANLSPGSWTLTGRDVANALAPLRGASAAASPEGNVAEGPFFDDVPVNAAKLAQPADRAQLPPRNTKASKENTAGHQTQNLNDAAAEIADAAASVTAAAAAVSSAAHQVAHACDRPADEAISTINRAADEKAAATNRAVDAATVLARSAANEATRAVSKLQSMNES